MGRWVGRTGVAAASAVLPLAADDAWALVSDVRNHVRWIPLTRIDAAPSLGVGDRFTAVSGPGAVRGWPGLADTMVVERSNPPDAAAHHAGIAVYRKLGPVLLGRAAVRVDPRGPASCVVTWYEAVHLRGLPAGLTAPLLQAPARLMLHVALRAIRRELGEPHADATIG